MGVPVFLLLLSQTLLGSGDPAPTGSDPAHYARYASVLLAQHEYAKALSWIAKGLAVAPGNASLRLREAIALHALGKTSDSLKVLDALPPSGETAFYIGLNYRALGEHALAQKNLSQAWEMGFRDPYALYSLIDEDHALGDASAGVRHFQTMLREFPDSPWLHVLYANAYILKDQDDKARAEYEDALRLKQDLPIVNFRLGYLMYKNGEYARAAEYFRREISLNPSYSDANLFLGQTLRQLDLNQEAVGYLRKALALDSRSELAYRSLAAALTANGDLSGAVEVLLEAEKAFPQDPSIPAQLVKLLTQLNRTNEALREQTTFRLLTESQRNREVAAPNKQ